MAVLNPVYSYGEQPLLLLREYYHQYRNDFMQLGQAYPVSEETLLQAFRRALIAWYEVRVRRGEAPIESVWHYLQEAGVYFLLHRSGEQLSAELPGSESAHPLYHYLPGKVNLTDRQRVLLEHFGDLGERCQEVLLLSYYHAFADDYLAQTLELPEGGGTEQRQNCLFLVYERMRNSGLYDSESFAAIPAEKLLDDYLRGTLDEAAHWDVEAQRQTNPTFHRALDRQEEWMEVIRVAGRRQLHDILEEEDERLYQSQAPSSAQPVDNSRNYYWIIGSIFAVVIAWFWYQSFDPAPQENLAYTLFEPYPDVVTGAVGPDTIRTAADAAFFAYREARWSEAYQRLNELLPSVPAAPLYLGVTALALRQPEQSQRWLENLPPDDPFYAPAQWYLSLAYLATGQQRQAQALLLTINGTVGHPYREQAARALARIK